MLRKNISSWTLVAWSGQAIFLIGLIVFAVFPIYWLFTSAFKTTAELSHIPPIIWPRIWTMTNFITAVHTEGFGLAFRNSIVVSMGCTLLSLIFGVSAGIGLSRFEAKGLDFLRSSLVLSQVVPTTILLVPLFTIWYRIHLYNTLISLVITDMVFGLPLASWLLYGYFSTIPRELEEQALIDGSGRIQAIVRIILPLSLPGLASTAIYIFLASWNEYVIALILTATNNKHTLPVFLAGVFGVHTVLTQWNVVMAIAALSAIPALVLVGVIQRYFVGGLIMGSVKG
jgi:multiple sugar transport system permease protein